MLDELCIRANRLLVKIKDLDNRIDGMTPGPDRAILIAAKERLDKEYRQALEDIESAQGGG